MALGSRQITIPKERMIEILQDGDDVVEDMISGKSRWAIVHRLIFKFEGKLYETSYQLGATEQQDEGPWEYEKNVKCTEVEAYQRTVTDYRPVK